MELRSQSAAQAWVAAGLSLARLARSESEVAGSLPWLIECVSEMGRVPPPGVVVDLGLLFSGQQVIRTAPLPRTTPTLREALRSYEDHVLGRIGQANLLEAVIDAFAALSPVAKARAVGITTANLVRRLGGSTDVAVALSPGILRRVVTQEPAVLQAAADEALRPGTETLALLEGSYRALTTRAHRLGALITEADLFILEHLEELGDLNQRLAIDEVLSVSSDRRQALPKRIKARKRPPAKKVATSLADEDHYPTGGFSSIATSGSMENLVISELIYMEDDESDESANATDPEQNSSTSVDLFDLRYAEGGLLYYTRDESQFVRDHRAIGIIFDADLSRARVKDSSSDHQRIVEVLASVHCGTRRLVAWLSEQALHVCLVFVEPNGTASLAAEKALLGVLFGEEIERGLISIACASSVGQAHGDGDR